MTRLCLCMWPLAALAESPAAAEERPRAIAPPPAQDAAEQLVRAAAAACNRGDFPGFMGHFTTAHASRIRGRMEDLFIKYQPQLEVRQVTLLSADDDTLTFGLRYTWHDRNAPEEVFASKVIARKVDGQWKLAGERVKSVSRTASDPYDAKRAAAVPAAWNPFDPPAHRINPALEHLRGDVGIQPGLGCANGRCGLR